jgi:flap endonuclease-1
MMGIPTFQADGEAEALCAHLAIHGYVDAVLTEDSDVLAYGTPWMVAFRTYKTTDEKIMGIYLPYVLDVMGYTVEEFRDLCILLSCDYNNRVKGFPPDGKKHKNAVSIGRVAAVCMMDEYRSLEVVEDHVEDMSPLIYERCRELFTTPNIEEIRELIKTKPYNGKPDMVKVKEFIEREGIYISIDYIKTCWEPAEIVFITSEEED